MSPGLPYGHMGATLTDAVLQSGISYETVVLPRVERILRDYPDAVTTSAFAEVLEREGAPAVLQWNGSKKIATLSALVSLLVSEHIETEAQFRTWLESDSNLSRLHEIKGIKDKTAHYLQILVGGQGIAIDRHLVRFLAEAGVRTASYDEARQVLRETAALVGKNESLLDYSIWLYMSKREPVAERMCAST